MSILIKGLKMPTSCLKGGCPVDGFFCQLWEDKYWSRVESPEKMRHKNCPLIELPDHGDLVDRDDFIGRLQSWALLIARGHGDDDEWVKCIGDVSDHLYDAPVVIPAERSEASLCDNCDERSDVGCSWCKRIERREE